MGGVTVQDWTVAVADLTRVVQHDVLGMMSMMSDYEASLGFVTDITVMKKRKKVSEI